MAERFELGGESFGRRFGARGEQQPIGGRGVGVRHAVFEPLPAEPEGVDHRLAGIKAGAFQPRRFARHSWSVVVQDGGLHTAQRASAAFLRRRVAEIDEDFAAALRDLIGANRVAADQRRAAGEIEFPIVPVAGQHASRPDCAFAQRIALVRAAIGDREYTTLLRNDEHLLAVMSHELLPSLPSSLRFNPVAVSIFVPPGRCHCERSEAIS